MVYVILGNGFEEMEAIAPVDILRRGGVQVQTAGIGGTSIRGAHGITVEADTTVEELCFRGMEMIVLPGGMGGVHSILGSEAALSAVQKAWNGGRFVAAICAAPTVLATLGITDGKEATCYPGMENEMGSARMTGLPVVRDGNLICGQAAGAAVPFGLALLAALKGEEAAEKVRQALVCP